MLKERTMCKNKGKTSTLLTLRLPKLQECVYIIPCFGTEFVSMQTGVSDTTKEVGYLQKKKNRPFVSIIVNLKF